MYRDIDHSGRDELGSENRVGAAKTYRGSTPCLALRRGPRRRRAVRRHQFRRLCRIRRLRGVATSPASGEGLGHTHPHRHLQGSSRVHSPCPAGSPPGVRGPNRCASSTRSPSAQLRPSAVNTRAGSHTGGVPSWARTMHAKAALVVSVGMGVAEPVSGRGAGGTAGTGAGSGAGALPSGAGALPGAGVALVGGRAACPRRRARHGVTPLYVFAAPTLLSLPKLVSTGMIDVLIHLGYGG